MSTNDPKSEPSKKEKGDGKTSMIFVQNLPSDATNEELEKVFSQVGPVRKCFVVTEKGTKKCRGFGYVKYVFGQDADLARTKFKGFDLRGHKISLDAAKPRLEHDIKKGSKKETKPDQEEKQESTQAEEPVAQKEKPEPTQSVKSKTKAEKLKKFRLIVRNLAWTATEADVREFFSKFGEIFEIVLPPSTTKHGGHAGYCFVNFTNLKDTTAALKGANGQKLQNRTIAVDYTLQKSLYQEHLQKQQQEKSVEEEVQEESGEDEKSEDDDEMHKSGTSEDEGSYDKSGSEDEEEDSMEMDDEESEERPPELESKDVAEHRTLFVSNLPFSATEDQLEILFGEYGSCKAQIVLDRNTGESKGSAFVEFVKTDSADLCLEAAYLSKQFLSKKDQKLAKKKLLKGDKSKEESDIALGGRRLIIKKAVSRAEAHKIVDSTKNKKQDDKRNLHLAEVGVIKPEDPEAAGLSAKDLAKRADAWKEKKMKLANPNFHISPVRLSVRNIPKSITKDDLKKLFVEHGTLDHGGKIITPAIKQVSIITDPSVTDEDGKPVSRGFGFVEFKKHLHAYTALKNLNNKPKVFPASPKTRLMVEFAVENMLKVKQRKDRLEKEKKQTDTELEGDGTESKKKKQRLNPDGTAKKNRGARQRERKRQLQAEKEARKEDPSKALVNTNDGLSYSNPLEVSQPKNRQQKKQEKKQEKYKKGKEYEAEIKKRKREDPFFFDKREAVQPLNKRPRKNSSPAKPSPKKAEPKDFESMVMDYKDFIKRPTKKWDEV